MFLSKELRTKLSFELSIFKLFKNRQNLKVYCNESLYFFVFKFFVINIQMRFFFIIVKNTKKNLKIKVYYTKVLEIFLKTFIYT